MQQGELTLLVSVCSCIAKAVGLPMAQWDSHTDRCLSGKESACNAGDLGLIPGSGRFPWRRKWQPTPVFSPGKSHGRRRLVGYSPGGGKESDMIEETEHTYARTDKAIIRLYWLSFLSHPLIPGALKNPPPWKSGLVRSPR